MSRQWFGYVLLYLACFLILLIWSVPFVWMVLNSFKSTPLCVTMAETTSPKSLV